MADNNSFARYVAPARASAEIWRLVCGIMLAGTVYVGFFFVMFTAAYVADGRAGLVWLGRAMQSGRTPTDMIPTFLSFAGMTLGVFLVTRLVHRRRISTLFGPDLGAFLRDLAITLALGMILFFLYDLTYLALFTPVANLAPGIWLRWLPLGVVLVLIQTSAEEILFRAYLVQQLAARFSSPLIWMLGPALLFGLAHYRPQEMGANTWLLVAGATIVALVLTGITRTTGNLGAAMGLHFVSNFWAILVIAPERNMSGFSLYITPLPASDPGLMRWLLLADIAIFALIGLVLHRLLRARRQNAPR